MEKYLEKTGLGVSDLSKLIYNNRERNVILDADLAAIYGYTTKAFNQQVMRNKAKSEGEEFMFQLSADELSAFSRSQNVTLNKGRGSNIKYLPYAFTEQGIYMLMTVLHGELATKQSRALVIAFKKMKDYILDT